MIYANDQWIQLPTVDLYDTLMMLASVLAAKDMYEKGQQAIKDFQDKYGDFYTPIEADARWYKDLLDKVYLGVNNIYARGGDPLRNAHDRAEMQMLIRQFPTSSLGALKANAALYGEYEKAKLALQAAGKYDPSQDAYIRERMGLSNPDNFSTVNPDGTVNIFNNPGPAPYKSLHDLIDPLVDNTHPGLLTKDEVESFGLKYNPAYQWKGVSEKMLRESILLNIPGVYNDPAYNYFRDVAEQKVRARKGNNYTQADVDEQFRNDAFLSIPERLLRPMPEVDPLAAARYKADLDLRNAIKLASMKPSRSSSSSSGGGGSSTDKGTFDYQTGILKEMESRKNAHSRSVGADRNYLEYQAAIFNPQVIAPTPWNPTRAGGDAMLLLEYDGDRASFAGVFDDKAFNEDLLKLNRYRVNYTKNDGKLLITSHDIINLAYGLAPSKSYGISTKSLVRNLNNALDNGETVTMEILDPVAGWATRDKTGLDQELHTAQKMHIVISNGGKISSEFNAYYKFGNTVSNNYGAAYLEGSTKGAVQNNKINKTFATNTTKATGFANVYDNDENIENIIVR